MSEPVCRCEHPKMFFSKKAGKEIFVSCGKCLPCRKARQSRWVVRLQKEAQCHLYTQVILLEYDDDHIPRYDFSQESMSKLIECTPRLSKYYQENPELKMVDLNELHFNDDAERNYLLDRLNGSVIALPHASVYDIQLFKKRLNTKIKRQITGKYGCFRSAIVAEYGSTTFRPHYHGILFFDDARILEKLSELVRDCWVDEDNHPLGFAKVEPERGHFASYISKYITKPADIPQVYDLPQFKTFFLTSRHPPIGTLCTGASDRYVFDSCSPYKVEFVRKGDQFIPQVFPIGSVLESRIFPKCPLYNKVSRDARFTLYNMIFDPDGLPYENYEAFFNTLLSRSLINTHAGEVGLFYYNDFPDNRLEILKSDLDQGHFIFKSDNRSRLVCALCGDFKTECSFHLLYSVGRRIMIQSKAFGVSFNQYLNRIFEYYDVKKPMCQMHDFYREQSVMDLSDPDFDKRFFYPLTFYRSGVHPEDAECSKEYVKELKEKYYDSTRNHRKNAYFESKRLRDYDPNLYLTIKNYYYAKKCDEALEAIA